MDKVKYGSKGQEISAERFKAITHNQRKVEAMEKVGGFIKKLENGKKG